MQKFEKFFFEKFDFDEINLKAKFFYSFDGIEKFVEEIDFNNNSEFSLRKDINLEIINNLLFHFFISLGISYYKLYPTNKLIIKYGFLDDKAILFWKKFYLNGLGEFFIKNNFDIKNILNFEIIPNSFSSKYREVEYINNLKNRNLLMWGGGKDSIVSSILLEEKEKDFDTFVFGKIDNIKAETLKILGRKTILVKRKLSNKLFEFNKKGYYNGHVPITGIIAFASLVSAYLYDYKNIVLSNEASANEENIIWKGLKINHQYSKSYEFENDFRNYVQDYIGEINYYSILSDKYEIEISEIFSNKANKYFSSFSSCNKNFKINGKKQEKKWCCECEKCAFVYLILSSHLDKKDLDNIFGNNLFENKNLYKTYLSLLGIGRNKPFECVGTYAESKKAFNIIIEKYKKNYGENKKLPYILNLLQNEKIIGENE